MIFFIVLSGTNNCFATGPPNEEIMSVHTHNCAAANVCNIFSNKLSAKFSSAPVPPVLRAFRKLATLKVI